MHSSSRGQPYNPVRQAIRALCEFAEGCSSASGQGGACLQQNTKLQTQAASGSLGCRFAGFFASRCGESRSSGRRFASVERNRSPISTHRSTWKRALPALALAALAALAPVAAAPSVLAAAPTALAAVVGAAAPAAAPAAPTRHHCPHHVLHAHAPTATATPTAATAPGLPLDLVALAAAFAAGLGGCHGLRGSDHARRSEAARHLRDRAPGGLDRSRTT
mmetsp:Transcript_68390/g.193122  ORF Transcript_68390/g.193122 Transcript_68390/m.193122 type:complete len:220 (+) Transcript_68390:63-722(+)